MQLLSILTACAFLALGTEGIQMSAKQYKERQTQSKTRLPPGRQPLRGRDYQAGPSGWSYDEASAFAAYPGEDFEGYAEQYAGQYRAASAKAKALAARARIPSLVNAPMAAPYLPRILNQNF